MLPGNPQAIKFCQSHANYLIHIVIAVGGESADEAYVLFQHSTLSVFRVESFCVWSWNWIVRLAARCEILGILAHNRSRRQVLPRCIFDFHNASKLVIVRVIDLHCRLEIFLWQGLRFEAECTIGQATEA